MGTVKARCLSLIRRGTRDFLDEDTNRRIVVVNLFSMVGVTITLALVIRALAISNWPLATFLLISACLFAAAQIVQQQLANHTGRIIGMTILLSCLMFLMAFLLVTGGVENTGPLWIYTVPPVTLFFAGFHRGLVIVSCFTLLIALLLFFPHDALLLTAYSSEFKSRLLLSFMTITFLSAFYEYSRETSYEKAVNLRQKFEQQAMHDQLTRLPNRRGAYARIEQEERRLKRHGRPFSLVLADIDHFKAINDQLGHSAGDVVLQRVASLFTERLRAQDIVSRWGGEEFLFILPETPENNALLVAEQLRSELDARPIIIDGNKLHITASFGVCEYSQDAPLDRALSLADSALYRAKRDGRNRVVSASVLNE